MAISLMIQKASPSLLPLARRAISSAGPLHGSIFPALNAVDNVLASGGSGTSLQSHQYSTGPVAKKLLDNSLLKVLRSEIKSAQRSGFDQEVPASPSSFPFRRKDNPGERTITLTREFPDETIEVEVDMPLIEDLEVEETESEDSSDDSSEDDENDSGDEGNESDSESKDNGDYDLFDSDETDDDDSSLEDSDDGERKEVPSVPMTMTVRKGDGRRLTFESLASADEICVEDMSIKEPSNSEQSKLVEYSGPDFQEFSST